MNKQRGFSLAELMVAMAMLAVVLAGIFVLQRQGQYAYLMGAARVEAQQNTRLALDLMVRELRTAQSVTTATGCDAGSSDLTFVDQNGNTVRYQKNGANLQRTVAGAMNVLITGVQSLTFRCYGLDGNTATAAAAGVRSISISLQASQEDSVASYSPGRQQMVASDRVRLRNL